MLPDISTNKVFVYPKFVSAVNSSANEVELSLDIETQFWLKNVLVKYFDDRVKEILQYRIRPWSCVCKVKTNLNRLYILKIPAAEFHKEAQITELIESFNPDITTKIIARNKTNGSFLMAALDGETLRAKVRRGFDQSILEDSAARIGKFQKDIRGYIFNFEQINLLKWTSQTIIENCEMLTQNFRFLFHTELSNREIVEFRSLFPSIQEKLSILTNLDKGLSIDHGDFQDNNIFVSKKRMIFMDWADACISIPSFTIATYCHSVLLAHPSITGKHVLIQNILTKYYSNLLGSDYGKFHQRHISLIHFLYPMICVLRTGRLLNLEDERSDKYVSTIIDYWIRIVLSFSGSYRDKSLCNEIA